MAEIVHRESLEGITTPAPTPEHFNRTPVRRLL